MDDREFTRRVIVARISEKRRFPHATAARNLLKKSMAKMYKEYGHDCNVLEFDTEGNNLNSGILERLQEGLPIILKASKQISVGEHWLFDPDKFETVGEMTIKLDISNRG